MKISNIAYSIIIFIFISSCKEKEVITPAAISTCDFGNLSEVSSKDYSFDGALSDWFIQTNRWESVGATLSQINNQVQLSASGTNISEAWLTHTEQMPYNKSWKFSVELTVPLAWNTARGNEPQVGIGIFVGKPEPSGQSKKVYECNLAVIGGDQRFVQGQLITNRLGGDPIKVDRKVLTSSLEMTTMTLQYCESSNTLTLLIDGETIGIQNIGVSGSDNWGLSENSVMDIGIMGFAENTDIVMGLPVIDNFKFSIF